MAHQHNIRLLIEYDGTPYCGWQSQAGLPSVQDELSGVLRRLTGEPRLRLSCAGRTDAGVHAFGQVVNFHTDAAMEARRYTPALNRFLSPHVRVHRSDAVSASFDARFAARAKRYRYRIYQGPQALAVDARRAWHCKTPLDLALLRQAAAQLVGEHDFNAFRSSQCDAAHAVRRMLDIEVQTQIRPPVGHFIDITFYADAFCRHMCRILAGTLVEVAQRRRPPEAIAVALQQRVRPAAGVTAPPWGLTLLEVIY